MKKVFERSLFLTLLFFSLSSSFAQPLTKKEFIKAVQDADVLFYYDEDYDNASKKYEALLKLYPENHNLAAKLGICYLNVDGKKSESLKLLKSAVSYIVKNDDEYTEYGELAPLDSYLYLAVSYHQNDSLEKAIKVYTEARKRLGSTQLFSVDYIDNQIKNCKYAIEVRKSPQPVTSKLFVSWLALYPGASNPVISQNDSVFLFSVNKDGKSKIYCSYKTNGWKKPTEITRQLDTKETSWPTSITADGRLMIIYINDGGDGNLYFSQRTDSTWSKAKSLGRNINTIYWESHGYITPDGLTMYIASNRPGGIGELDIWKSVRDAKGVWSKPVNCGNTINTRYNENTPYFDAISNTMYFSSLGHTGMGGYDVFRSIIRNGSWTKPQALPYKFNTTGENNFFITENSIQGFITSMYDEIKRERNIYALSAGEAEDKKIYAHGELVLQDGLPVNPDQTRIELFDFKTGALVKTIDLNEKGSFGFDVNPGDFRIKISPIGKKSDTILPVASEAKSYQKKQLADTGTYIFEIKPGDYQLHISHTGYKTDTVNLNIPLKLPGNYIAISSDLIPSKVAEGKFLSLKNILFEYNSYELSESAIVTIKELQAILINYPELNIEVSGYTDSKGSTEYNLHLADKRAQAIIDLLIDGGISKSRIYKKAIGSSDFAALNTNPDGTDNPEGRKYNRRATFGIISSRTGIVLKQETYTPKHLLQPGSIKYCIVLEESKNKLSPEHFTKMKTNEMFFVSSVSTDSLIYYIIGDFYSRTDALIYLEFVKTNGFKNAYLSDRYTIHSESTEIVPVEFSIARPQSEKLYTIQISAARAKIDIGTFKNLSDVQEVQSSDGYYRYFSGRFSSVREAEDALPSYKEKGYKNAFIRNLNLLKQNSK